MEITKKDIDKVKLLKKVLSKKEMNDFIELLKKDFKAKVVLNGNIKISYFDNNGNLAYEYEIFKSFDKNLEFEINLSKTLIRNLLKILDKKEIELLLKRLKRKYDYISFYKNYIQIVKFEKKEEFLITHKYTLTIPKQLKIMRWV